jgi:alpha-ketoglutarate-dependent taurine dioxygenase
MKDSLLTSKGLKSSGRKTVTLSQENMVKTGYLIESDTLPLVIQPSVEQLSLPAWAMNNTEFIERQLLKHGAILFRGFDVKSAEEFGAFIKSVSGELLEYRERSSPRHQVSGNVYTSTDYPPNQSIFLHNENSYQHAWPLKLFFYCHTPAQQGGETPIADVRKVFRRIEPSIRERFAQKKIMYVRNFSGEIGLSSQTVFCASDKSEVEKYCSNAGIECEWTEAGLRTRQVRPAIAEHPRTGESVWFNHATFFHESTLPAALREGLLAAFDEEDLPHNTYYGDGSPIEPAVLDHLRHAYTEEAIAFSWNERDILMLDNMLVAHGRYSYLGPRRILVGMAELIGGITPREETNS